MKFKDIKQKIEWVEPDFDYEMNEYFGDNLKGPVARRNEYKEYGYEFKTKKELKDFLKTGTPISVTPKQLRKMNPIGWWGVNMSNKEWNDVMKNVKNIEDRKDWKSLSKILKNETSKVPMPIIIKFGKIYSGYAGHRRTNLAIRNHIPLKVWMVEA